jgi:hypothetical protein
MKKKLVAALALVLVCFSATSATAQDEAWFIDVETIPLGQTQLAITESGSFQNSSTRFSMPKGVGSTEFAVLCPKGQADGKCDFTSGLYDFNFTSVLPACSTSTQEDCVESLRIGTTTGALQEAKFVRQIKGTTFTYTDMARGLYEASTVSLWQSAGSDGLASQDYAVTVRTLGHYDAENDRYVTSSIDAAVSPYRLISGSKYSA